MHLAAGGMKVEARLPSRWRCRVGFASSWRAGAPPASPMARLGVVIYERREAVKAPGMRYGSLRSSLFISHPIYTFHLRRRSPPVRWTSWHICLRRDTMARALSRSPRREILFSRAVRSY